MDQRLYIKKEQMCYYDKTQAGLVICKNQICTHKSLCCHKHGDYITIPPSYFTQP